MSATGTPEHEHPMDRLRRAPQGPELSTAGLSVKRRSAIGSADGLRPPLTPSLSDRAGRACGGGGSTRHPVTGPRSAGSSPTAKEREMTRAITGRDVDRTDPRNWRDQAACRKVDPELFFPVEETAAACAQQVAAAKAVCARCPVRRQCLDDALTRQPYGIAGGLTANERRRMHGGVRGWGDHTATRPQDWTRAGMRRSGIAALRAGASVAQVMHQCSASRRTVERWVALTKNGGIR
jgi:hypothetical protein